MGSPYDGRGMLVSPGRLRQLTRLGGVRTDEVLDRARHLCVAERYGEQVHLVVLATDLVGHAAGPRLDLAEASLVLVVARLADVDAPVGREAARAAFEEARVEHDEALLNDALDGVVAILARLCDLVLVKVLVEPVHRLLWVIVPACVDHALAVAVLPRAEDLGNDGLVVGVSVLNMDPVS